jgi:hypothetical protein
MEQLQKLDRGELDLAVCSQLFPDRAFFAGFETLTLASERLVGIIPPTGASELPVPKCLPAHVADSVPGTLRIVPIPDLTEEIPVVVAFQRRFGESHPTNTPPARPHFPPMHTPSG